MPVLKRAVSARFERNRFSYSDRSISKVFVAQSFFYALSDFRVNLSTLPSEETSPCVRLRSARWRGPFVT